MSDTYHFNALSAKSEAMFHGMVVASRKTPRSVPALGMIYIDMVRPRFV